MEMEGFTDEWHAEVREVPSEGFPTLAAALAELPPPPRDASASSSSARSPVVVVRLAAGSFHRGVVRLPAAGVILDGSGGPIRPDEPSRAATLLELGPAGLEIVGEGAAARSTSSSRSVLRRLRICAENGGTAISILDASPFLEDCEVIGTGSPPARGARSGLLLRGRATRGTIVRSCRVSMHSGAGVSFEAAAGGLFVGNEVSRCGCGFWIGAACTPILWHNIAFENSGAGVVARASAGGHVLANTLRRNAIGLLLESDRSESVVVACNGFVENLGPGLKQSRATKLSATESGAVLLENTFTENDGALLHPAWPSCSVEDAASLVAAIRSSPLDRHRVIEIIGCIALDDPLILDRPVLLIGRRGVQSELSFCPMGDAAIVVAAGGETAGFCWLTLRCRPALDTVVAASACVAVDVGQPFFLQCFFTSAPSGSQPLAAVHSRADGAAPLMLGCVIACGERAGVLVDSAGATAYLLGCEVSGGHGSISLGGDAAAVLEECRVGSRSSFAAVIRGSGSRLVLGRTVVEGCTRGGVLFGQSGPRVDEPEDACSSSVIVDRCAFRLLAGMPALSVQDSSRATWWRSITCLSLAGEQGVGESILVEGEDGTPSLLPSRRSGVPLAFEVANGVVSWLDFTGLESDIVNSYDVSGANATAPSAAAEEPKAVCAEAILTCIVSGGSATSLFGCGFGLTTSRFRLEERRTLYSILLMLAERARCPELPSAVGLAGPVCSGEVIHIRGHAGQYVGARCGNVSLGAEPLASEGRVGCFSSTRGSEEEFIIMSNRRAGALQRGDTVTLEVASSGREHLLLSLEGPSAGGSALALPAAANAEAEQTFKIVTRSGAEETIEAGSPIYFRAMPSRRLLEVSADAVRAGTASPTPRNQLSLDKVPPAAMVPAACPPLNVSPEDQAWLFRRGVQNALVEKQQLARLLSEPNAPSPAILTSFATLWEAEWRKGVLKTEEQKEVSSAVGSAITDGTPTLPMSLGSSGLLTASAASAQNVVAQSAAAAASAAGGVWARAAPTESEALARIRRLVRRDDAPTERANGDLFVKALRSFFADALQVSQLEANNVMRIVEAFAGALASDSVFVQGFTPSMLPEDQRRAYRTPEEIFFGLAYTTMMLNTDTHSSQVTQKTWNQRKFVAAGRDCGVQGALMAQIYKRIVESEL